MNAIDVAMTEFDQLASDRILVKFDGAPAHIWLYRCSDGSTVALETPRETRGRKCAKVWSSTRPTFAYESIQSYAAGKSRIHSLRNTPLDVKFDAWALRFDDNNTPELRHFIQHVRTTGGA